MNLHQILSLFLLGHKRSSLRDWSREFPEVDYTLLTAFFRLPFNVQKLLMLAATQLFTLQSGYFILDEIVVERSKLGTLPDCKFRYKSTGGYVTPSVSIVLLLWTDGRVRVPLRFELRQPGTGSHIDAALRLLSWARNSWRKKPLCVLFDSGFASGRFLQRVSDYGWAFICRVPKRGSLKASS
ncbi:MAG: transposase [Candidatus Sericytochromatia bacterium]